MGCQKEIAAQIVDRGGDYVLTVKDNQPHLRAAIEATFNQAEAEDFEGWHLDVWETTEHGHGREETRTYSILTVPPDWELAKVWSGLRVIGICISERTLNGKTSAEVRYFIG